MPVYEPEFILPAEADGLLRALAEQASWQREILELYGRKVPVPRQVAWCGEPGARYRYSGRDHLATGWLPALASLRERLRQRCGASFDFALLNRYEDGSEYMGWHTDDEPEMTGIVASVSLGGARRFLFRPLGARRSQRIVLEHGSLLLFDPRLRHTLPRCAAAELRINVTFRQLEGWARGAT